MRRFVTLCLAFTVGCTVATLAQIPETLEQAKALASERGKPLLVEFFHDD
jgi:hypothetical protein